MWIDNIFICHFFNPDTRIKIFFEKAGAAEKRGVNFEREGWNTGYTLVLGVLGIEENLIQRQRDSLSFWRLKRIAFFSSFLAVRRPILSHYSRAIYFLMLIIAFWHPWPESHFEAHNEVRSLSLTKLRMNFELEFFQSNCNALTH